MRAAVARPEIDHLARGTIHLIASHAALETACNISIRNRLRTVCHDLITCTSCSKELTRASI